MTPPRPTTAPPPPTYLDGAPVPRLEGAKPTWCLITHVAVPGTGREWRWESTWALHAGDRGLAIQYTVSRRDDEKNDRGLTLAVLHVESGLLVVGVDASGDPVPATPRNLRRMTALVGALLEQRPPTGDATPVDSEGRVDWPRVTAATAWLALERERAVVKHLPGKPAWRAHRATSVDGSDYERRWFASAAAAKRWRGDSRWWAVEVWSSRPPRHSPLLSTAPDLAALARGDFSDCHPALESIEWYANGATRMSAPGEPAAAAVAAEAGPVTIDDLRELRVRIADESVNRRPAPTGELDPTTERLVAAGLLAWSSRDRGGPRHREPSRGLDLTRRGLMALSRTALAGAFSEPGSAQRTTDALGFWRDAKRGLRADLAERWRLREEYVDRSVRLLAWLHLLSCVARDRRAAAEGRPRIELPTRYDGELRVLSMRDGVAAVEVRPASRRWEWVAFRTAPAVSWARDSAVVPARVRVADGHEVADLHTAGAADWCERLAEEMRGAAGGTP